MDINKSIETFKELLMFRQPSSDDDYSTQPIVTIGSIVWGIIFRSAIVIIITLLIIELDFGMRQYGWQLAFILWIISVLPAWKQYGAYTERIEKFQEETLCGSCRYFDNSAQMCRRYDQHVSRDFLPCEGNDWEPRHIDSE